ncbi:MAG: hypothetical protein ACRDOA_08340 [Streptosporangiaceae bacterium]
MSRANTSATAATTATPENSGRQLPVEACSSPMTGPMATAPKMHKFMITGGQEGCDVAEKHPPCRQVHRELDGQHGADRVPRVGPAGGDVQRRRAQMQALGQQRCQRQHG